VVAVRVSLISRHSPPLFFPSGLSPVSVSPVFQRPEKLSLFLIFWPPLPFDLLLPLGGGLLKKNQPPSHNPLSFSPSGSDIGAALVPLLRPFPSHVLHLIISFWSVGRY